MEFPVLNFKYGVVNNIEDHSIPDGAASDSLNWITSGDKIELRRGSKIKGATIDGAGSVTGLHTAYQTDGTEVLFRKRGAKLEYYNTSTLAWAETGTDMFGTAAVNDEASFANYQSLAGAQLFVSSPNSGIFKIMTANPASYSTMHSSTGDFRGIIKIKWSRMFLWGLNRDKTALYGSHVDEGGYTDVTGEATASLGGTLAFKAGGAARTCFGLIVTLTVSGEVFTDNNNGTLTGSLGNTGTINYTSGVYTLSIAGTGTVDYSWEDSTSNGICDFTYSSTRVAGEGFVFRQDDGGALKTVMIYNESLYCIHEKNTYRLVLTNDDTNADNNIFRERVGVSSWKGATDTGRGVYYVDTSVDGKPEFKLLTLDANSGQVVPQVVSLNIDLTSYNFDENSMFEWYDYIFFTGKSSGASSNDRMFIYNKIWQSIDILDYYADFFATDDGALICGDSVTYNVWTLFSGFDDDDATINNYWAGNFSLIGKHNLKKNKELWLKGLISTNQLIEVYVDLDNSGFTYLDTIDGNGDYVDKGQKIYIGATTVGSKEIGGGGDGEYAYMFEFQIKMRTSKFRRIKIKFVATELGYASISEYNYHNILTYKDKMLQKYEE